MAYRKIAYGADGKACLTTGYRRVPPGGDPVVAALPETDFLGIFAEFPPCPRPPGASGLSEPTTPSEFAVSFWQEIPLPSPEPSIAPGRAITGLPAYLETNGVTEAWFSLDTPFGPMEIVATGYYTVDWGDGTHSGPFAFEGDPWPDGEVMHTYQYTGTYDIEVVEIWAADWRIGNESGRLTDLRTVGRIEGFPVGQIQAVVGR